MLVSHVTGVHEPNYKHAHGRPELTAQHTASDGKSLDDEME